MNDLADKDENDDPFSNVDSCPFDEDEFQIPNIERLPSLTSILNEQEDEFTPDNEISVVKETSNNSAILNDSLSVHTTDSSNSNDSNKLHSSPYHRTFRRRKTDRLSEHGMVTRHLLLKAISRQLVSVKLQSGLPSALAVAEFIAIGMSRGTVFIFDYRQALKWCFGDFGIKDPGAVTALSFNVNSTRLLVGHATGLITMWDLDQGKNLRVLTDVHTVKTSIIHAKFTNDLTTAVISDTGGSVYQLDFTRKFGIRSAESKCLFPGSNDEVCVIEPLLPPPESRLNDSRREKLLADAKIVAFGTMKRIIIQSLKHSRTIFEKPFSGKSDSLPLLCWKYVVIQMSEIQNSSQVTSSRRFDPVLAVARDRCLSFFQLLGTRVLELQQMMMDFTIIAVSWLTSHIMGLINSCEKLHIMDVLTTDVIQVIDLCRCQMIYGTLGFKGMMIGTENASKALQFMGDTACYYSVTSFHNQLFILGLAEVHALSIRPWKDRINVFVRQNRFEDALRIALCFYNNSAKAVVGLPYHVQKNDSLRHSVVSDVIAEILVKYVKYSMTKGLPKQGSLSQLKQFYQSVIPVCVDYCLLMSKTGDLLVKIYDQFAIDDLARETFLDSLVYYVDTESSMCIMNPIIVSSLMTHLSLNKNWNDFEICALKIDVSCLDIHHVMTICKKENLFDGIIRIHNDAFHEYGMPLVELNMMLNSYLQTPQRSEVTTLLLGNKLLVYTCCCLCGRPYPSGEFSIDDQRSTHLAVYNILVDFNSNRSAYGFRRESIISIDSHENGLSVSTTVSRNDSRNTSDDEFSVIRTLIQFNTREFLNVLSLAFNERWLSGSPEGLDRKQTLINVLVQIFISRGTETSNYVSLDQQNLFCVFLARQLAQHYSTILLANAVLDEVIECLLTRDKGGVHSGPRIDETEQAIIELLESDAKNLVLKRYSNDQLIDCAMRAKYLRLLKMLHEENGDYDKVLAYSYLNDPFRKYEAVDYIRGILYQPSFTDIQKEIIQREALKHLTDLLEINCSEAVQLMLVTFGYDLERDILPRLKSTPLLEMELLKSLFDLKHNGLLDEKAAILSKAAGNRLVELMCVEQPNDLKSHLVKFEGSYDLEIALQQSRKANIADAASFCLIKLGRPVEAFHLLSGQMQKDIKSWIHSVFSSDATELERCHDLQVVRSSLSECVHIGGKYSSPMLETERQDIWFTLLEIVSNAQVSFSKRLQYFYEEKNRSSKNLDSDFEVPVAILKSVIIQILTSMIAFITPIAVMEKLIENNACATMSMQPGDNSDILVGICDMKDLLSSVVSTYSYEKNLLKICTSLFESESSVSLNEFVKQNSSAVPITSLRSYHYGKRRVTTRENFASSMCASCHKSLLLDSNSSVSTIAGADSLSIFTCAHKFHINCINRMISDPKAVDSESEDDVKFDNNVNNAGEKLVVLICPICHANRSISYLSDSKNVVSSKMCIADSNLVNHGFTKSLKINDTFINPSFTSDKYTNFVGNSPKLRVTAPTPFSCDL